MKTEKKLKKIFSDVFKVNIDEINSDTSPNNCSTWDSFNMMKLIIVIEKEFDITLDNNDVIKLSDFKSCFQLIKNKLVL